MFLKEIPLNADYEILTYLPGWEQQKWSYLSIAFITRPKSRKGAITSKKTHENGNSAELEVKAEAAAKELLKGVPHGQGSVDKSDASTPASISDSLVIVPPVTSLGPSVDSSALTSGIASPIPAPFVATNGSPSSAEDNSGAPSPEMQEALDAIRLRIPEGATLHAVAVSQYCYKLGRVTIPPRVALIACGFGDPSRKRWERLQQIRDAPDGERKMKQILRGGWKDRETWGDFWDLDEFEERGHKGAVALKQLRAVMGALSGEGQVA